MQHALRVVSVTEEPVSLASPEIVIVRTTAAHIRELAETIREADRKEIEAYGFSSAKGLWRSYKQGVINSTALIDGKVAAIWGCGGTYLGPFGQPWLLTSYEVKKISPLRFAKIYQREVHKMLKFFPYLVNYVHNDYDEAKRLLSICGFTVGEPERKGNGMFCKFERRV